LEFENARAVQALYGGDDKLLRELEAALDVRVTSREGWLRIEGGEEGISRARKVFEQLNEARKRGVVIRRPEFNYAVHAAGRNGGTDLGRLLDLRIRLLAKPPSSQDRWPEIHILAMQTRDITFRSAPPGRERPTWRWRPRCQLSSKKRSIASFLHALPLKLGRR
jgi:phosphate starvation-inducible PhoH-like protein